MTTKNPVAYTAPEAVFTGGKLYHAGEVFVTNEPKNSNWEAVDKVELAANIAADKTVNPDPNYDEMTLDALKAVAAEKRVPSTGLAKKELITAIKAASDPHL